MQGGGSIESISIRGRLIPVTADADAKLKIGGFETETQANGDGTVRPVKTRVPWSLTDVVIGVDDDRGDMEFLQDIADGTEDVPIVITLVTGVSWQGSGRVTGELSRSTMAGTSTLSLSGPGRLEQQ